MTNLHVEHNSEWKQVKDAFIGRNGNWVKEEIRLIGHQGKWVESYSSEPVVAKEVVDITRLNYRGGAPLQGALELHGRGFSDQASVPYPPVGAFYRFNNPSELFENFANIALKGTETPLPVLEGVYNAYAFDISKQQYAALPLSVDSPTTYFDLLGLMGNDGLIVEEARGKKYWEIGCKFKAKTWPAVGQVVYLMFSGTETQNISISFDSTGTLTARFKNSTYEKVLQIPNVVVLNEWCGFSFRHRPEALTRFLELQASNGVTVTLEADMPRLVGAVTYKEFNYWVPAADVPINIGYGITVGASVPAEYFFLPENTSPSMNIAAGGFEIGSTLTTYRNSMPSGFMEPGTGRYYLEILNYDSYDVQLGVTDATLQTNQPPGLIGWCVNTINGRKFAKQTGGGTAWTATIPANSVIGLVYDSDIGRIEIYVNGVKRTDPFAAGTITVPVKFIIGGRAETATTKLFKVRTNVTSGSWTYSLPGVIQVPMSSVAGTSSVVYSGGSYRDLFVRNAPMLPVRRQLVLDPNVRFEVVFTNKTTNAEHVVTQYVLKRTENLIIMSVPELPEASYYVSFRYVNSEESNKKLFTIKAFQSRTTPLVIDFATSSLADIRKELMLAHKQWGGANGGVSADNVTIDKRNGVCELRALGDNYIGPVLGVNIHGKPSGFNTRIGACLVTRDYFGPGSYRILCKAAALPGVCTALWTFHYEEGYPGSPLQDLHMQDGLHLSGNEVNGFYSVRNHEIDIEFPTALKTNPNQEDVAFVNARFNTWRGELRNWDVPNPDVPTSDPMYSPTPDPAYWSEYTDDFVNHGVNLADQQYHELRFDWHLGMDPRVEFYIDGVLKHTNRTHIPNIPGRYWAGMWFPSGSTQWAGRGAPWTSQTMLVKQISITPFADEYATEGEVSETYPNDVFRDFIHVKD